MIEIYAPSSKSWTQRAVFLATLAEGKSRIINPLVCDDSHYLSSALEKMGAVIRKSENSWEIEGTEKLSIPDKEIFLGNAGTAVRFIMALSLVSEERLRLDGSKSMRRRSHRALIEALKSLGIRCEFFGKEWCLPAQFSGPAEKGCSDVETDADLSSQFISALLMVAPLLSNGLKIKLKGKPVSQPYINMTIRAMEKFGVRVSQDEPMLYKVPAGSYEPAIFQIEADATSSAYILASAWILNKEVKIINLPSDTLQGDIIFDEILEKMKEEGKLVLDLNQNPDLVPAAVAVSIFRNGETEIVNVKHLKNKESDRLSVLCSQLALLNADIHETEHGLVIKPSHLHGNAVLNPHEDHRMAMAFAITGLRLPDIEILDKKCVSKSFPDFFEIMEKIR